MHVYYNINFVFQFQNLMQPGNTTEGRTQNVSFNDQDLVTIYTALGIAHLIIVVVPSLVLSSIVLYYLLRLMKTSGVKPVTLLVFFLAILCMLGPRSYGIIWDISLYSETVALHIKCILFNLCFHLA